MKKFIAHPFSLVLIIMMSFAFAFSNAPMDMLSLLKNKEKTHNHKSIKLALLLDTSNSMDGLIEQAKSQLWNITKELSMMRYDKDKMPELQIALYEYGNDGLSGRNNFIRKVVPFTTDMDLISEKLFALRTNGGSEYCGAVINDALKQLDWGNRNDDLKMIYIAGNEPFTQGPIHYKEICRDAHSRDIVVNTIFCGDYREGVNTEWKAGADMAHGSYFNIDKDCKTVYIPSPYDDRIEKLNYRLNDTYIPYGSEGKKYKENQEMQDANASSYSQSNAADRAAFKCSGMYKAESWDLIDAYEADEEILKDKSKLPEKLQNMSEKEVITFVKETTEERVTIQKEVIELEKKRREYVDQQQKNTNETDDLQKSILSTIRKQATEKGLQLDGC